MQTKNNNLRLINLLRARTKLIYVVSNDEQHTVNCLRQSVLSWMLKQSDKKKVDLDKTLKYFEWSIVNGLQSSSVTPFEPKEYKGNIWKNILTGEEVYRELQMKLNSPDDPTNDIMTALTKFENEKPATKDSEYTHVIVIKDIHGLLFAGTSPNPMITRKIKEIILNQEPKNVYRHIIILSPVKRVPVEIENMTDIVEWKLPDSQDVSDFIKSLAAINIVKESTGKVGEYTDQEFKDVINSFVGLPYCRIEEHSCQCYAEFSRRLDARFLSKLKTKHIMENSSLELVDTDVELGQVGGMETFKNWVNDRTKAYSKDAEDFGVEPPKGVMLVGIQGCGKTLMSRAISRLWGIPLVKFDVAKVFSKNVGDSEQNIRNTLHTIEALAPVVVQIDEIEKALSGMGSSNMSDGGTTARVVGTLLSWMQDKTAQAFIIATANDVSQLPPELLRKGRFDEIFFCALPDEDERVDIFKIHLKKRKYDPEKFNIKKFAEKTKNYSGAEIEQIIKSAILVAFNSKEKKLNDAHIMESIKLAIPLYDTAKQDIEWLLAWVGWDEERKDGLRARFASASKDTHADADVVADTKDGKKIVMKMKTDVKKV